MVYYSGVKSRVVGCNTAQEETLQTTKNFGNYYSIKAASAFTTASVTTDGGRSNRSGRSPIKGGKNES